MNADAQAADAVTKPEVELAAQIFAMLSDTTRIRIILALEAGERSVGELAEAVGKAGAAVSQHLAKLRWAGIVRARHVGARVLYTLVDEHAGELVHQALWQAEHAGDSSPRHHRPAAGSELAAAGVAR